MLPALKRRAHAFIVFGLILSEIGVASAIYLPGRRERAKALEVIRGGGELVQAEKQSDTICAVSGIYAGKQCAACHERPGEMLGAFSYRLSLEEAPAKVVGAGSPVKR